jgi:uncharacterized membrane protein YccF (DUF307 family)
MDVNPPQSSVTVQRAGEPGCLIQSLWFIFVGWWLGSLAISLAWVLNVTIIGLPLGMAILNNIPKILALQNPERYVQVVSQGGRTYIRESDLPEHPFLLRALFFLLIGWWWSGIWLGVAFVLCATIILLPVGLGMFRMAPAMTTLERY